MFVCCGVVWCLSPFSCAVCVIIHTERDTRTTHIKHITKGTFRVAPQITALDLRSHIAWYTSMCACVCARVCVCVYFVERCELILDFYSFIAYMLSFFHLLMKDVNQMYCFLTFFRGTSCKIMYLQWLVPQKLVLIQSQRIHDFNWCLSVHCKLDFSSNFI